MRWLGLLFGLVLFVAGVGCLNYTVAFGIDKHRDWAEETGFPHPRPAIFFAGLAGAGIGAGMFGYCLRRRR